MTKPRMLRLLRTHAVSSHGEAGTCNRHRLTQFTEEKGPSSLSMRGEFLISLAYNTCIGYLTNTTHSPGLQSRGNEFNKVTHLLNTSGTSSRINVYYSSRNGFRGRQRRRKSGETMRNQPPHSRTTAGVF